MLRSFVPTLFAFTLAAPSIHSGEKRPNILVVLSDDHSAVFLGCYGNKEIRTPNLDKLALSGMRLDRAYVTTPQCVPSRASIMTGRSPISINMTRFSAPLPREVKIFPEYLRERGYFTGVAGRTYHLDGAAVSPESKEIFAKHKLQTFRDRLDFVKTAGAGPANLAQFREFLDLVPKRKNFFLQLCFSEPHRPLDKDAIPKPHDPAEIKLPPTFPDTKAVREDLGRYYDEVARLDVYIGELIEELRRRGLLENTIILFMGDNGGALLRGKGTLHKLGLHVPLLVAWPGRVRPGQSSDALISGEDLGPTLLEAAGLPVPKDMTGRSFLGLLTGEKHEPRRHVFCQRGAHGSGLPKGSAAFDLGRCVITPRHKLIYNALWQIPYQPVDFAGDLFWKELQALSKLGMMSEVHQRLYFSEERPIFELYDLEKDPWELENLAGQKATAELERQLMAALQEWMILERDFVPLPIGKVDGKKAKKK